MNFQIQELIHVSISIMVLRKNIYQDKIIISSKIEQKILIFFLLNFRTLIFKKIS